MIRILVQEADAGAAANVGGPVHTHFYFIDLEHGELERLLSEKVGYVTRRVIGAEVLRPEEAK